MKNFLHADNQNPEIQAVKAAIKSTKDKRMYENGLSENLTSNTQTAVFLPPNSPKIHLVEGLWGWLKKSVIYNVFYKTVEEIRKAVQGFSSEINKSPLIYQKRLI